MTQGHTPSVGSLELLVDGLKAESNMGPCWLREEREDIIRQRLYFFLFSLSNYLLAVP